MAERMDEELFTYVPVKDTETGKVGITARFDEEEVDRRLKLMEERLPARYKEVIEEVKEFHRNRRAAFERMADEGRIEIVEGEGL